MSHRWQARLAVALVAALWAAAAPASAGRSPGPEAEAAVRLWLQNRLGPPEGVDPTYGYALGWADVTGDARPEAFALMSGMCGTGGCNMYVLQVRGTRVRMLGRHTVTRAPIALLDTWTNGKRDFAVASCTHRGCNRARIQFDGWKYWSNPSMAPVVRGRHREQLVLGRDAPTRPLFDR